MTIATQRFLPPGGSETPELLPCPATFDDSLETNGITSDFLHGIKAPRTIRQVDPEFSDAARKALKKRHVKHFAGVSVVSMIVGVDGIPRDLCLKQSAGYGLDVQAAKAASQYRFEPATTDGRPVSARIAIEVSFRLY